MSEIYTCSIWQVPNGREGEFPAAFAVWAGAADDLGAKEGLILQDEDDPARFIVVRRWKSRKSLERWRQASMTLPAETSGLLHDIVPGAEQAYATRKVGDLGRPS